MPEPGELRIRSTPGDAGAVLLTLAGEIDLETADAVHAAVASALDGGATAVDLDLTGITFLDSSGIRALLGCRRDAAGRGARFTVAGASATARRVLELTGVWPVLAGGA